MTITAQNIVFSISSAKRIAARKGWKLEVWPVKGEGKKYFWLHIPGKRPRFYSLKNFFKDFEIHFIDEFFNFRKSHSNLEATMHAYDPLQFGVRNLTNNNLYSVVLKGSSRGARLYCECDDWHNQNRNVFTLKERLGGKFEACCKHCYEVERLIKELGYRSIQDYLNALLQPGNPEPDYEAAIASINSW